MYGLPWTPHDIRCEEKEEMIVYINAIRIGRNLLRAYPWDRGKINNLPQPMVRREKLGD